MIQWGVASGIYAQAMPSVYQVKSAIEKLFQSLQITAYSFINLGSDLGQAPSFLHLGQWAQVLVEGKAVGFVGTLHPRYLDHEKIRVPMAIAELDLQQILKGQPRPTKFKSLSKFQPVLRDFAFMLDSQKLIGDLLKEIKKSCGANLRELLVFDIYEGAHLQAGQSAGQASNQKSVALRASFQSTEVALTEADLQQLSQKLVDAAKKSVGAVLR